MCFICALMSAARYHLCFFYVGSVYSLFFFFNDTATTEIYTLSLHDALPIYDRTGTASPPPPPPSHAPRRGRRAVAASGRSEEHTSELQSQSNLVCRLLLEKKKKTVTTHGQHRRSARAHPREDEHVTPIHDLH